MKSLSHVWLSATPWIVACQASTSMGFSRQQYWSGLPFPSPNTVNIGINWFPRQNWVHITASTASKPQASEEWVPIPIPFAGSTSFTGRQVRMWMGPRQGLSQWQRVLWWELGKRTPSAKLGGRWLGLAFILHFPESGAQAQLHQPDPTASPFAQCDHSLWA